MPTLIELTSQIVSSHASRTVMTPEQLLQDMHLIHETLKSLEANAPPISEQQPAETTLPVLTIKQAFKKNEVICMVCNKGGFKTLTRHLAVSHSLTPRQYRKQFNIPTSQKLSSKISTEARVRNATERGMVEILAKARATRMANIESKKNLPAEKVKPAVPKLREKAKAPAVRVKARVPEKLNPEK